MNLSQSATDHHHHHQSKHGTSIVSPLHSSICFISEPVRSFKDHRSHVLFRHFQNAHTSRSHHWGWTYCYSPRRSQHSGWDDQWGTWGALYPTSSYLSTFSDYHAIGQGYFTYLETWLGYTARCWALGEPFDGLGIFSWLYARYSVGLRLIEWSDRFLREAGLAILRPRA